MMITKLGILDFQSIRQLAVECGPITVFVGESDSGKSAVVRALYAAAFNDYPIDHVREGGSHSMVVIATEGGSVQVEKGKGVNKYALQRPAGRTEWDRVGREVPQEAAEFLGWRVVELDDGTKFAPSIQRQFDGPFLLSDSPVRTAKVLGSLTNISTLFAAIREGTLMEKRARKSSEAAIEESKRHASDLEKAEDELAGAQRRSERARTALAEVERLKGEVESLEVLEVGLVAAMGRVTGASDELAEARERIVDVPDLDDDVEELQRLKMMEDQMHQARLGVVSTQAQWGAAVAGRDAADVALATYVESMEICPLCERAM